MIKPREYDRVHLGDDVKLSISELIKSLSTKINDPMEVEQHVENKIREYLIDKYFSCTSVNEEINSARLNARSKALLSLFAAIIFAFSLAESILFNK